MYCNCLCVRNKIKKKKKLLTNFTTYSVLPFLKQNDHKMCDHLGK